MILALKEFYTLFKATDTQPQVATGITSSLVIYILFSLSFYWPVLSKHVLAISIVLFSAIALIELFRNKSNPFQNIGITISGMFYTLLPILLLNLMIEFDPTTLWITSFWPVLSIFILIWCSDTFAYLVGRKIGKTKLFERISPKKSWEGFIGGMISAIIGGLIIAYFTDESYLKYTVFAIIISAVGTAGDLVESMLKRSVNAKDSGTILPGHGGILDRIDAILIIIPIIFYLDYFIFN